MTITAEHRIAKQRRHEKANGIFRTIPVGPVRDHVNRLLAQDMSTGAITQAAGVGRHALQSLRNEHRIRADTGRALMTVQPTRYPPALTAETRVPAVGTMRRLQALQALGWPHSQLKARTGVDTRQLVAPTLQGRIRRRVDYASHAAVEAVYETLCMTPGPSGRTRTLAGLRGYLPPLAWDDPDDPTERPYDDHPSDTDDDVDEAVVLRVMAYDVVPANRAERTRVVASWQKTGRSLGELEDLTGWNVYRYTTQHAQKPG